MEAMENELGSFFLEDSFLDQTKYPDGVLICAYILVHSITFDISYNHIGEHTLVW